MYSVDKSTIIAGVPLYNQVSKQFFHEIFKENEILFYSLSPRKPQQFTSSPYSEVLIIKVLSKFQTFLSGNPGSNSIQI